MLALLDMLLLIWGAWGHIRVKVKHWSVASHTYPSCGLNGQPGYVPWSVIEPRGLLVCGMKLQPAEPQWSGQWNVFKIHPCCSIYQYLISPARSEKEQRKFYESYQHHNTVIFIWQLPGNRWQVHCRHLKYCRLRNFSVYPDMVIKKPTDGCLVCHMFLFVAIIKFTIQFNSFANFLPKWACEQVPT